MNGALKWKLAAGFLLVFIAGAVTGALAWNSHARHMFLGPPRSGALAQRLAEHWRSELGLTPEQYAKLRPVMDRTASQLETIRIETARRVRQMMTEAQEQMAADLTPEQRAKFAALEKKHRHHLRHRGFRPPPRDQRDR